MKILHTSPLYFPTLGGAPLHMKEISEGLASRGHKVTVLTANVDPLGKEWPREHRGLPALEVINGVRVVRFSPDGGLLGSGLEDLARIRGGYRSLRFIFGEDGLEFLATKPSLMQIIPYLLHSRADIVASMNWYFPPAYQTYVARRLKPFTLVGIPLFHTAEAWCNRNVYTRMLTACDAVIVNTLHESDFVRERTVGRVEVAGVGVHAKLFERRNGDEIRARYRLGSHPVAGFVGRQLPNKGAARLLQAMRMVWKWNDEVRLVLAGPPSLKEDEREAMTAALTPFEQERIIRIDDFPEIDKASIFDSFDVFVLPSKAESFGIAYLEAWLCRKPVIGARVGSTQCVIDDGTDGLLVDPDDPLDIARAIIDLLSDADKREKMGNSGYAKTIAEFTWEKVTDKIERLYLDLLAAKSNCKVSAKAERLLH